MKAKETSELQLAGKKIRQTRILRDMTQKELAEKSQMSESAIRNYELGNRYPDQTAFEKIAKALEVDISYLQDADPYSTDGALQILFLLEDLYGLHPEIAGNDIHLVFGPRPDYASPMPPLEPLMLRVGIAKWLQVHEMYASGEMSKYEYVNWKMSHPSYTTIPEKVSCPFDVQEEAEKYIAAGEARDEEIRQLIEGTNNDDEFLARLEELVPESKAVRQRRHKPAKPKT